MENLNIFMGGVKTGVIVVIIAAVIYLLVTIIKTLNSTKPLVSKLNNISSNLDASNKKVEYINMVSKKSFLPETLSTLFIISELRKVSKRYKDKKSAVPSLVKTAAKYGSSISSIANKIKAL